jgi:hypothetical protein
MPYFFGIERDFCFVSFLDVFLILVELSSTQGTRVPASGVSVISFKIEANADQSA